MQLKLLASVVSTLGASVLFTAGTTRDMHTGEVSTAHDLASNDPSLKPELTLDDEISQSSLFLHGVDSHISDVVSEGSDEISSEQAYTDALLDRPELFDFFKMHADRYFPQTENGPTAVNADFSFKGISDRKFGYCWGFATLIRYFEVLAFFDPSQSNPAPIGGTDYENWIQFYKSKIDQITRGKATVIPGFHNLRELSLVPELELYIKLNTMELWRNRALSATSLSILNNASTPMTGKEQDDFVDDLEARLARGEFPKIVFSSLIPSATFLGFNEDIHVVLVYGVERLPNQDIQVDLWDVNFYAETLAKTPKFFTITPDHLIKYEPWYEPNASYASQSDLIARALITPENDGETVEMLKSLKRFCEAPETSSYCSNRL